jgi:hypothetical protein
MDNEEDERMPVAAYSAQHYRGGVDSDGPRMPERNLLIAVLARSVQDANGYNIFIDGKRAGARMSPIDRRRAKVWFRKRQTEMLGWFWLADLLNLCPSHVERVERVVFATEPVHILSTDPIAQILLQ